MADTSDEDLVEGDDAVGHYLATASRTTSAERLEEAMRAFKRMGIVRRMIHQVPAPHDHDVTNLSRPCQLNRFELEILQQTRPLDERSELDALTTLAEAERTFDSLITEDHIARIIKDLSAFGLPGHLSNVDRTNISDEETLGQVLPAYRSEVLSHFVLLVSARTCQNKIVDMEISGNSVEAEWVDTGIYLYDSVTEAASKLYLRKARASPVHSAVLEKLDHFGPPVSALDFAVGYHPRTIIIRESNTHVQLEGTTTVDYCVLRLHQITPTLSSAIGNGVFFPFLITEFKGPLGSSGTAMVELLSGMYAALRAILQLSEVAHKTALEKGQEERFMSPTPIMRRVTGWLAYGSTWSFWLLSADGDLEGCAARATETHTLVKLKTCDASTEEGAMQAAVFLRKVTSEAEDRLERLGNWLWCLRDSPVDPKAAALGHKRSATAMDLHESPVKKAKAASKTSFGGTGTSTRPQAGPSRLRTDKEFYPYPARLEGWDSLSRLERKKSLIKWWNAQCKQLRQSRLVSRTDHPTRGDRSKRARAPS